MTANHSYSVILEPQEGGGFTVIVPALPEVVRKATPKRRPLPTRAKPFERSSNIGRNKGWHLLSMHTPGLEA
jgi:antitoxin HicB